MSQKELRCLLRREAFVKAALQAQESLSQLCRNFGWSRKRGYKWKQRFQAQGLAGLRDQNRRPARSPRRVTTHWLDRIRRLRRVHRRWGARKLAARLGHIYPRQRVPAARTIGKWLRRLKLTGSSRRRTPRGPWLPRRALTVAQRSNQVWTVDFKGWFRTQNGQRVEPLTVRDLFSRYVLAVRLLPDQSWRPVRRAFLVLFGRYGCPERIRVDNGGPFGSSGPAGLSRLSAWWTALGIQVEFIAPGHPEQNGAHEQMHRVFKAETTRPASCHRRAQQRRTNRWVQIYNQIRPHEALGQRAPASVYRAQPRAQAPALRLQYGPERRVRRVRSNGQIRWRGRKRFVGEAFVGYPVGLQELSPGKWTVYFAEWLIGELWESDPGGMRPAKYARRLAKD